MELLEDPSVARPPANTASRCRRAQRASRFAGGVASEERHSPSPSGAATSLYASGPRANILRDKSTTSPHLDPLAAGLRAWRWSLRERGTQRLERTTRSKACAAISGGGRRRPPARPRPRRRTSLTLCFTLPASIDMICASSFACGHCPKVWAVAACEARLGRGFLISRRVPGPAPQRWRAGGRKQKQKTKRGARGPA